ncbi:hypothetical protein MNBD_PLANCTO03-1712 [hydrothermal vent metagenome]|uniref:Glycosyltransferase 2-like domain-containing protein n=1 Tax=hydrothermal vent metagenome TaxID=652676 RepID=A0A3B1DHP8_9ZZZZ
MTLTPAHPGEPIEVSVVIPMFREAARIDATLRDTLPLLSVAPHTTEVVLVDDGSPDSTIDRVMPYLTDAPQGPLRAVRLVRHKHNLGKGAAVRTGLDASRGSWRLIMDADNAATIRELPTLLDAARPGIGLVAGSRVAPGSRVDAIAGRKFAGSVFKLALRALGLDLLTDTQCGFKLYRTDLVEQIVELGREDGYAFDLEHLLIARATGLKIAEVGIRWTHQEGGQVNPIADGLRMLRRAAAIRARRREIMQAVKRLPQTLPTEPPMVVMLPVDLVATRGSVSSQGPASTQSLHP